MAINGMWLEWEGFAITQMTIEKGVMILLALLLLFLAIAKKQESLLLIPLAFGMLIANLPVSGLSTVPTQKANGEFEYGLMYYLYQGIELGIYPPLIFLCLGAMTDFGPLLSNPKSAIIGLGGQLGIFVAFGGALLIGHLVPSLGIGLKESAAIGIIGSSDGPTTIFTAQKLASGIMPIIAISAYSYMALVPFIQPPIMKALTTKKERRIVMPEPRKISRRTKIIFPIILTILTILFVPAAGTLIAMLMLGNLIRESGVAERHVRTLSNDLLNILTMLIGLCIGASAVAEKIFELRTIIIISLGLFAFCFGTVGGVLIAKLLNVISRGKVNPLIGNSGVSAMPMAARVSQKLGQKYNPDNHLLMHAMGPIVASTIGSAIIAGLFIAFMG